MELTDGARGGDSTGRDTETCAETQPSEGASMKQQCVLIVLVILGSVGAGTAQSSKNTEPPNPAQAAPKARTVTVTGCVGSSPDGQGYVLNEAIMAPRPIDNKGSEGRVAAPSGDKMVLSYMLEGGDLKRHLGHKVQISASVVAENTMAMDHKDFGGTLKVKALKMIATNCTT